MKYIFTFFICVYTLSVGLSQKSQESLETRIETLEKREQIRDQNLDLQTRELKLEADKFLNDKAKELEEKQKDIDSKIRVYGLLFAGISALGFITIIWGLVIQIKKQVNFQMEKRIDSLIKEKEEYFKQLIKSQEVETQIREKTKLLVLSSSEETDKQIMKVISKFKFPANNISNKIIQPNGGLDHKDYKGIQIIIINDIDSSFDRPLLNRLLADSPGDSLFLGYATGKENLPRDEKMNFANSKFTFYQNLINLAKYKEVVS